MKKFEATGSLVSLQRSGRPSTAAAVATTVEQTVQSMSAVAAHGLFCREVSRQSGVSYGSVWKALRITLKRYPYKLQHKQELLTSTLAENFAELKIELNRRGQEESTGSVVGQHEDQLWGRLQKRSARAGHRSNPF
ncbi:transposable element tc3 transposase [Caerostris extrusa]|uniref:Transposable element tc3 transposase n=1 Tax=Caerostris extrusa TaxID=172846 RepID=A0AAV4NMG8_CAEEX|nr:transposable element tc3 transposase [Caerostris extrusa]